MKVTNQLLLYVIVPLFCSCGTNKENTIPDANGLDRTVRADSRIQDKWIELIDQESIPGTDIPDAQFEVSDLVMSEIVDSNHDDIYVDSNLTDNPAEVDLLLDSDESSEVPCSGGPAPVRALSIGGDSDELVTALVGMADGGVLLAISSRSEELWIGDDPAVGTGCTDSVECVDAVLVRLDGEGEVLWSQRIGGSGRERVVTLDEVANGDILVAGHYSSSNLQLGVTELTPAGQQDGFIARFSSAGEVLWAMGVGGAGDDGVSVITTGDSGSFYVGGWFRSDVMVLDGVELVVADKNCVLLECGDLFLGHLSEVGELLWLQRYGGIQGERFIALERATDGSLLAGGYHGSWEIDFGGGPLDLGETICGPMFGCADAFTAHLSDSGEHLQSQGFGGDLLDYLRDLSLDNSGNVLLAGVFTSSDIDFGGGPLPNIGDEQGFAAGLTQELGYLWSTAFDAEPLAILPSTSGVLVVGRLQVWHKGLADCIPPRFGGDDIFLAALDGVGEHLWTGTFGGEGDDVASHAVSISERFAVAGFWSGGPLSFGASSLANKGARDVFLTLF
jgi:hypothetical protein